MELEIRTLYHVSVAVAGAVALLLLLAWAGNRRNLALAWWGGAMALVAISLELLSLRGRIHHIHSIAIANALVALSAAGLWTGARVLAGKAANLPALFAGAVLWIVASLVPAFYGSITARTILISTILGVYTLLLAYELWSGSRQPTFLRWVAVVLIAVEGAQFLLRDVFAAVAPLEEALPGSSSGWYIFLMYETILYMIALGFLLLALASEKAPARRVRRA